MCNNICKICGEPVAKYLYGMPDYSKDLKLKISLGKVYLGGCCIYTNSPIKRCIKCGIDYYKNGMGIFNIDYNSINYDENFTIIPNPKIPKDFIDLKKDNFIYKKNDNIEFIFEVNNYKTENKRYAYKEGILWIKEIDLQFDNSFSSNKFQIIVLSNIQRNEIEEFIFNSKWKNKYDNFSDDGTQWSLLIKNKNNNLLDIYGSNIFPRNYYKLNKILMNITSVF